ncbi:hypothetical protein LEN26_012917 [Aphanomyces euteiches]|nr:hypothetical protein AeMF1_019743 [Aphanomyces euteiches]KAH9116184.1 hypothetical protein LEN26_012917 [Aphanomyces euteiches]
MIAFFKLIELSYDFTEWTRGAIMDYSGGAPGVFGSLIRITTDHCKWHLERHEWDEWFNIQTFSYYLDNYNWTYRRIRNDLKDLSAEAWEVLKSLLQDSNCCSEMGDATVILLEMVIIIKGTNSMAFSSENMRRICMDALPIRDIKQL